MVDKYHLFVWMILLAAFFFFCKSERSLERTECNNRYLNQNPSCRDTSMPSSQRPTEPFASCTFSSRYDFFFFLFLFAYCLSNPRDLFSLLLPLSSPTFYIKRRGTGLEGGVSMETNHYNKCTTIWIFPSKPNEKQIHEEAGGFHAYRRGSQSIWWLIDSTTLFYI